MRDENFSFPQEAHFALYAAAEKVYKENYHDITIGSAGSNTATEGWDFVTGLGTPKAEDLVRFLADEGD